ncbi:hypothetical protein IV203_004594 [Nitzschia inconspicua]|uniref:Gamma-glutamylcyclotransferase AIG2-like domain-containing protein n=1 Tax=Nitzschia inconspicua TaxID=303405 RepID=A0A9K3L3W1_9STRA|nr:hypothetical protein IV203_004594 [Nitzschia inconspicua]
MSPIVQHYVFGYGSLICAQSRAISAPTLATRTALPVRIHNVVRTWNKRSPKTGATYLGVQVTATPSKPTFVTSNNNKKEGCVGVLIPMDSSSIENTLEELEALDEREVGYDRKFVPLDWIDRVDDLLDNKNQEDLYKGTFLDNNPAINTTNSAVWMYVPQVSQPATMEYPIPQSYVDVCLRGCLSISESFMQEFITSTVGWNPQELVDLEKASQQPIQYEYEEDEENNDDDDENTMSESSSSSYTPSMMRGSHTRSNSEFSSLSSVMDWDDVVENDDTDNKQKQQQKGNQPIILSPDAWINDRKDPVYMRADRAFSLENATVIDDLIVAAMTKNANNVMNNNTKNDSIPTHNKTGLWNKWRVSRGKKELHTIRRRNQDGIKSQ